MRKVKNNYIEKYSFLFYFFIYLVIASICNVLVVKAEENTNVVDFSRKASISITLSDSLENNKVEGAEITIYKVADATSKDYNLDFAYPESLNSCKSELDEGNITNEVLDCVINTGVTSYQLITDSNGSVLFTNLDLGLYLVTQTNKINGYSKFESFIVMTPEILDNMWNYDIKATPKVDIIRLFDLGVEKVWNVSNDNNVPNKVTIELLMDDEVLDTVVLNKENNWTHTWKQIEKSDKYTVREINVPAGYTASYRSEGNKFIVTNTKSLVQTGQKKWIVSTLAGLGILFIGFGIILEKRKKYE